MSRFASPPRITGRGVAIVAAAQAGATVLAFGLQLALRSADFGPPPGLIALVVLTAIIVWRLPHGWLTRLQIFVLLFGLSALLLVLAMLAAEGLLDDLLHHARGTG